MGPRLPSDPALPGAVDLLGEGGRAMVGRFLAGSGWSPCAVDPVQVFYRPGRSMTVRFDLKARYRDGPVELLTVGAECRAGDPVRVWAFPEDPSLPGLPAAVEYPGEEGGAPPEMLRYRPRRRAVLRYRFGSGQVLFGKVLPPPRARRALDAASRLRREGGRPELRLALPTAGPAPGVLLVAPVAGRLLRDLLLAGDPPPSPARLARLSDDLATAAAPGPGLPPDSPAGARLSSAGEAARLTRHLLPDLQPALDQVLAAVARGIDSDPPDRRPVHGDLYEAQVVVAGDGTLGLIDLDDLGLGDPLVDAATFSAHLLALALSPGPATGRILAYRDELRRAFLDHLGAHERSLRWREAYAMLLLSPGPFRTLHPTWPEKVSARVEAAAQLLGTV